MADGVRYGGFTAMKPFLFRQWVAGAVMAALLFNVAAPLVLCRCDGCSCGCNPSWSLPDFAAAVEAERFCCSPPVPVSSQGGCGSPEMPCQCQCGNYQAGESIVPKAVLPIQRPDSKPAWDLVSVLPADFACTSEVFSRFDDRRVLLPPHVPLHVLLCVFLN